MRLRKATERAGKTATEEENNKHETQAGKYNNMCRLTVDLFIINECCLPVNTPHGGVNNTR